MAFLKSLPTEQTNDSYKKNEKKTLPKTRNLHFIDAANSYLQKLKVSVGGATVDTYK